MSLARKHQERILAAQSATRPVSKGGSTVPTTTINSAADRAARQVELRLQHDLRRLKEIKARDAKIAAKRQMLPEYRDWCDGELQAGRMTKGNELGTSLAAEALPTMMVWSIDIGDWSRALELAAHILRFGLPMPARYNRDAATVLLEEVADAALKIQAKGEAFPIGVLQDVEELTAGVDMHDEPRAKLVKALGTEMLRSIDAIEPGTEQHIATASLALCTLQRAHELHDRVGVKDKIKRLEKILKPATEPAAPAA